MPAARKLPADEELIRLHADGVTSVAIAAKYGCSPGAVSLHWSRLGLEERRARHTLLLPWTVRAAHAHAAPAIYLRLLSRAGKGETVTDRRINSAWRWATRNEADKLAVHYTTADGWTMKRRTKADSIVTVTVKGLGTVTVALGSLPKED